jgi:hypothetical protein
MTAREKRLTALKKELMGLHVGDRVRILCKECVEDASGDGVYSDCCSGCPLVGTITELTPYGKYSVYIDGPASCSWFTEEELELLPR